MRILLDECVPWPMHKLLLSHDCTTAQKRGWGGIKNGELLRLAEADGFELFITADQNIRYQQNLSGRAIRILELSSNKLRDIDAATQLLQNTIAQMTVGDFVQL